MKRRLQGHIAGFICLTHKATMHLSYQCSKVTQIEALNVRCSSSSMSIVRPADRGGANGSVVPAQGEGAPRVGTPLHCIISISIILYWKGGPLT